MQSFVGQILDGKYKIERELGRGGMGTVYFAIHLGTKRPVAVKVIVSQLMRSAEFVERFKREAEAAGRLSHPHVVNVTDFGFAETQNGQSAYLVMEYLDGCTLGEILAEEKKLPLSWTVDILEQICSAIDEAHRQGIIHRDLKPDNIWLEPNERGGYTAKVLDFGIAKLEPSANSFYKNRTQNLPDSVPSSQSQNETLLIPLTEDDQQTAASPTLKNTENFTTGYETVKIERGTNSVRKPEKTLPMTENFHETISNQTTLIDEISRQNKSSENKTKSFDAYQNQSAEITRIGTILGTPLYMSPEQCRAERLSSSSDIYSLGVITYQMLSGRTPFEGEQISVLTGHLQLPPPALPVGKIPRKVKKVIYQTLAKEPVNRPLTAEIFAGQMRSYSENIVTIFRRTLIIYTENFSKLIWRSLLLYLPTILLAILSFVVFIFNFNNFIPPPISAIVSGLLKYVNLAATVSAETLVTGAVMWIVVQYIDTPLRSFSVIRALQALAKKWKQFAWILPLRIIVNFIIQGDFSDFSAPVMFLLSLFDSLVFWSLPCVVMMENVSGLPALKRSRKLTARAIPTVTAALILNLVIFTIISVAITSVILGSGAIVTQQIFPSIYNLPFAEFAKFMEAPTLIFIKITGTILLPFFAVITVLIYLKTRYAGGESTKKLLAEFKEANIVQSNWQRKVRQRLEQSCRLSNTL